VFPSAKGTFRDVGGTWKVLRDVTRGDETSSAAVTSHTVQGTVATLLDHQGMSARAIADQLGHPRPSMTQNV
jgi:integrase